MSVQANLSYARNLAQAGWKGGNAAWNGAVLRKSPAMKTYALLGTLVGGTLGALTTVVRRDPRRRANFSVLIGSAIGFGGGLAWAGRRFTGYLGRSVIRQINTVRDAHWLEKNPIDYA